MKQWTSGDAGCVLDGDVRGWRVVGDFVLLALDAGWEPDEGPEPVRRTVEREQADGYACDLSLADEAETYLNDVCAPEGYFFGWHDGSVFLWSEASWQEVEA